MSDQFLLTLAQLNPIVGDLAGNKAKALAAWRKAKADNANMLMLPEMFLTGYQLQDLVSKPAFMQDTMQYINALTAETKHGPAIAIGAPFKDETGLFNGYYILQKGCITTVIKKHCLPKYTVFDEPRYFNTSDICPPYCVDTIQIGSPICEDAWHPQVSQKLAAAGAQMLLVPNGSPYERGKMQERLAQIAQRSKETGLPIVYLNLVGGQDDQVFDGGSFVMNPDGTLAHTLPVFEEATQTLCFTHTKDGWRTQKAQTTRWPPDTEQDYHAMVLALRDYVQKSGFSSVLLGLSGGIDSALVAAIATDALGAPQVHCVMLPSQFTSDTSLKDATHVASLLNTPLETLPITHAQQAVNNTLAPLFADTQEDTTEENIQSRLRGVLLMALSNKFGHMLLTTGNKSEVAVGYATLYGDMSGSYNPIKDLYKTDVFAICRWRNENHRPWMQGPKRQVIPPSIINKPPSAELREDQKDEDNLPPYDILDGILRLLVDGDASVSQCIAAGYKAETVIQVQNLLYASEYKRFQSAPGARLTNRAFWMDRRYPIVNKWRDKGT